MQGLTRSWFFVCLLASSVALLACANHNEECKPGATPTAPAVAACFIETPLPSQGDAHTETLATTTPEEPPSPLQGPAAPNNAAVIDLIREALQADQANNLDLCIEKDREAIKLEDMPRARLHLASCEARSHHLIDSLKDSEHALEQGIIKKDAPVMKIARMRVKETLQRIPHITFRKAAITPPLRLTFDGKDVPYDAAEKRFSVDPGPHVVEVTHTEGVSRCDVLVNERTLTPITIR